MQLARTLYSWRIKCVRRRCIASDMRVAARIAAAGVEQCISLCFYIWCGKSRKSLARCKPPGRLATMATQLEDVAVRLAMVEREKSFKARPAICSTSVATLAPAGLIAEHQCCSAAATPSMSDSTASPASCTIHSAQSVHATASVEHTHATASATTMARKLTAPLCTWHPHHRDLYRIAVSQLADQHPATAGDKLTVALPGCRHRIVLTWVPTTKPYLAFGLNGGCPACLKEKAAAAEKAEAEAAMAEALARAAGAAANAEAACREELLEMRFRLAVARRAQARGWASELSRQAQVSGISSSLGSSSPTRTQMRGEPPADRSTASPTAQERTSSTSSSSVAAQQHSPLVHQAADGTPPLAHRGADGTPPLAHGGAEGSNGPHTTPSFDGFSSSPTSAEQRLAQAKARHAHFMRTSDAIGGEGTRSDIGAGGTADGVDGCCRAQTSRRSDEHSSGVGTAVEAEEGMGSCAPSPVTSPGIHEDQTERAAAKSPASARVTNLSAAGIASPPTLPSLGHVSPLAIASAGLATAPPNESVSPQREMTPTESVSSQREMALVESVSSQREMALVESVSSQREAALTSVIWDDRRSLEMEVAAILAQAESDEAAAREFAAAAAEAAAAVTAATGTPHHSTYSPRTAEGASRLSTGQTTYCTAVSGDGSLWSPASDVVHAPSSCWARPSPNDPTSSHGGAVVVNTLETKLAQDQHVAVPSPPEQLPSGRVLASRSVVTPSSPVKWIDDISEPHQLLETKQWEPVATAPAVPAAAVPALPRTSSASPAVLEATIMPPEAAPKGQCWEPVATAPAVPAAAVPALPRTSCASPAVLEATIMMPPEAAPKGQCWEPVATAPAVPAAAVPALPRTSCASPAVLEATIMMPEASPKGQCWEPVATAAVPAAAVPALPRTSSASAMLMLPCARASDPLDGAQEGVHIRHLDRIGKLTHRRASSAPPCAPLDCMGNEKGVAWPFVSASIAPWPLPTSCKPSEVRKHGSLQVDDCLKSLASSIAAAPSASTTASASDTNTPTATATSSSSSSSRCCSVGHCACSQGPHSNAVDLAAPEADLLAAYSTSKSFAARPAARSAVNVAEGIPATSQGRPSAVAKPPSEPELIVSDAEGKRDGRAADMVANGSIGVTEHRMGQAAHTWTSGMASGGAGSRADDEFGGMTKKAADAAHSHSYHIDAGALICTRRAPCSSSGYEPPSSARDAAPVALSPNSPRLSDARIVALSENAGPLAAAAASKTSAPQTPHTTRATSSVVETPDLLHLITQRGGTGKDMVGGAGQHQSSPTAISFQVDRKVVNKLCTSLEAFPEFLACALDFEESRFQMRLEGDRVAVTVQVSGRAEASAVQRAIEEMLLPPPSLPLPLAASPATTLPPPSAAALPPTQLHPRCDFTRATTSHVLSDTRPLPSHGTAPLTVASGADVPTPLRPLDSGAGMFPLLARLHKRPAGLFSRATSHRQSQPIVPDAHAAEPSSHLPRRLARTLSFDSAPRISRSLSRQKR